MLVVGLPRSGTTWIADAMARTEGTVVVSEPDNEGNNLSALKAKRSLGRFPFLEPGDRAPAYERLWDVAFAGGPPRRPDLRNRLATSLFARTAASDVGAAWKHHAPLKPALRLALLLSNERPAGPPPSEGGVVVKSVFCGLALEWLAERWEPQVVVVHRHPFSVLASWFAMGWGIQTVDRDPRVRRRWTEPLGIEPPPHDASWTTRAAWHYGAVTTAIAQGRAEHPQWQAVTHEGLCEAPVDHVRSVCETVGLRWGADAERFLTESNRAGTGFKTQRLAHEQLGRWRTALAPEQRAEAAEVLSHFPAVRDLYPLADDDDRLS